VPSFLQIQHPVPGRSTAERAGKYREHRSGRRSEGNGGCGFTGARRTRGRAWRRKPTIETQATGCVCRDDAYLDAAFADGFACRISMMILSKFVSVDPHRPASPPACDSPSRCALRVECFARGASGRQAGDWWYRPNRTGARDHLRRSARPRANTQGGNVVPGDAWFAAARCLRVDSLAATPGLTAVMDCGRRLAALHPLGYHGRNR
jgi:hypothetical protein